MKTGKKHENEAYSTTRKLCPFNRENCLRQKCALWIKVHKEPANPLYTLHFEGCGLIQNIPWILKPNNTSAEKDENSD